MRNRIEFPITWMALGVLGAVMVPVNPVSTGPELDHVFLDTGATYLITEDDLVEVANAANEWLAMKPQIMTIGAGILESSHGQAEDGSWESLRRQGDPLFRPESAAAGSDLVNIQYTSGSKGLPKVA